MGLLQYLTTFTLILGLVSAGKYFLHLHIALHSSIRFDLICVFFLGKDWSDDIAKIVYAKIDYLLANGIEITNRFDLANATADPEYTKYVYDPTAITTTNDCLNKTHHKCIEAWVTSRPADIAFSARKLLRLAFHDCIPYKNGNHGQACDG